MKRKLLMLVMLTGYCLTSSAQSFTETRTGTRFNDNPYQAFDGDIVNPDAQRLASDDNIYDFTQKFNGTKFPPRMLVQGFGFTIPINATINSITVHMKGFKTGP